ncbi:MAG: phosphate/phosphite/phosphonate ABC transporter substrate-binding protein, partial [Myxococcales bacterium]|nr:phosphate/phosphite/phosphonate ABC transporter substrate-binding protein [Myxococcales bacterium]
IFLAFERRAEGLERIVVLKRILPHLAENPDFVAMFLREARLVARLSHPNVGQIFEYGEERNIPFFAMEYIHGTTSRELVKLAERSATSLPIAVALEITLQACRGLHAAHQLENLRGEPLGLVHRDITPHNLMISAEGHVKLVDFGVAKSTVGDDETYSGALKGKFPYMSPEQARNLPLDRRSDLFSLATVCWELIAGLPLFQRNSELETLEAVTNTAAPPLHTFRDEFPEALWPPIERALSKERDERQPTVDAFRLELEALVDELGLRLSSDGLAEAMSDIAGEVLERRDRDVRRATDSVLSGGAPRQLSQLLAEEDKTPAIMSDDAPTHVAGPKSQPSESDPELPRSGTAEYTSVRSFKPLLWIAALVLLLSAGGVALQFFGPNGPTFLSGGSGQRPSGEPVVLAWPPYVDPEYLLRDMLPLQTYLERRLQRPVEIRVTDDYDESATLLISGQADFANFSPLLFVKANERSDQIDLLVVKEFDGAQTYESSLIVRSDSSYTQLSHLEGQPICLVNRDSTSGYLMPRAYVRDSGFIPEHFFGEIIWSGQHHQALRDLINGRCEVAATYNGAVYSADDAGIPIGRLRVLAVTGIIPQDVIVAGPHTDPELREQMLEALLDFDPQRDLGIPR